MNLGGGLDEEYEERKHRLQQCMSVLCDREIEREEGIEENPNCKRD